MTVIRNPRSDDEAVQDATLRLVEIGRESPDAVVPDLLAASGDRRWVVSLRAYSVLGQLGAAADAAVPVILQRLKQPVANETGRVDRVMPVIALAGIGTRPAEVVPVLAELVGSGDSDEIGATAHALGSYGERAAPAVPALMRAADAGEVHDQMAAVRALGRIGPAARAAVPMLLRKFTGPPPADNPYRIDPRVPVAMSLGEIGPAAEPAVPALTAALEEGDAATWQAAALALARIGPAARPALPAIDRTAGRHPGEKSRLAVALAKVRLGNASEGWEALKGMALDNASTHAVYDTLQELGPASVPVLEAVVRSDSSNGWWAVQSLQKLPPDAAAKAVPALVHVLSAGRPTKRGPLQAKFDQALVLLGQLGPAAREAAPVLGDLAAKSPHAGTREAAAAALARIEAPASATREAATKP